MQAMNSDLCAMRRSLITALGVLLSGCAIAKNQGEWFTTGFAAHLSSPKVLEVEVFSPDQKIDRIKRPGAGFSYSSQDNLRVPDTVVLHWRAETDAQMHEKTFGIRSNLPADVIQKLQSNEPTYALSLNFRVRNGKAECLWSIARLDLNNPVRLAEGTIQ